MKKNLFISASFFSLVLSVSTVAQMPTPTPAITEEVTVEVTGTETRLAETPASVVVIDRQSLNQTAAQTVDETLRQVPGFTLFRRASSKTANPTAQGANLRGVSGSGAARTNVLFDSFAVNDAFGGWTYWTRIPRVAVEQIEVLRGGASSVYGAQALSGAINLISKTSETPVLRGEISAGNFETYDGSLFAAHNFKKINFSVAAETFQTAGYFPIPVELRGAADSRANSRHQNGFLKIERRFDNDLRIFTRANLFSERRDNGTNLQKNRTYFRQIAFGGDFSNENFGSFAVRASLEAQVYDQTFSAVSADRNSENLTRIQRVPSQAKTAIFSYSKAFAAHSLTANAEFRAVRGASDEIILQNSRPTSLIGAGGREHISGFFAQDFWRANDKLIINFGGRFDVWRNENAISTTRGVTGNQPANIINFADRTQQSFSPQVSILYQLKENFGISTALTRSFRAATLNELYRAFRVGNVLTLANENLRAERATNGEIGFRYQVFEDKINVRATVFQSNISNPVVSVTLSTTPNLITRQRQNLGATRSRGLEIDFESKINRDWRISAGYLLVDSRVTDFPANRMLENNFLPQIARQQLTFQTFYRSAKPFAFGVQGRISDAQFDDDQNEFRQRPFFTLDALASYRINRSLELFTAAENIFNNRYDIALTPTRNVSQGLQFRAGLRFNFSE